MSQDNRAPLQCTACKSLNYNTTHNPRLKNRLALKKFCQNCEKHVDHKQTK